MYTLEYNLDHTGWKKAKRVLWHQYISIGKGLPPSRLFIKMVVGGIEIPSDGLQIRVGADWDEHMEAQEEKRKAEEIEKGK